MKERVVIILAAGKGSRLKLEVPKVLAPLYGKPILDHTVGKILKLNADNKICVIGHKAEMVKARYGGDLLYRRQEVLNGNAGALLACCDMIPPRSNVLVVQGDDSAFVSLQTYSDVYQTHEMSGAKMSAVLTPIYNPDTHHRSCFVGENGDILAVSPISPRSFLRQEGFFTGVYCFDSEFMRTALPTLNPDINGEIGIPQLLVRVLDNHERTIGIWDTRNEWLSINTKIELAKANQRAALFNS